MPLRSQNPRHQPVNNPSPAIKSQVRALSKTSIMRTNTVPIAGRPSMPPATGLDPSLRRAANRIAARPTKQHNQQPTTVAPATMIPNIFNASRPKTGKNLFAAFLSCAIRRCLRRARLNNMPRNPPRSTKPGKSSGSPSRFFSNAKTLQVHAVGPATLSPSQRRSKTLPQQHLPKPKPEAPAITKPECERSPKNRNRRRQPPRPRPTTRGKNNRSEAQIVFIFREPVLA